MKIVHIISFLILSTAWLNAGETRERVNVDFDWRFQQGDVPAAASPDFADASWRQVDLPHDFSAEGDFSPTNASSTAYLPGGIAWYRKAVVIPADWSNKVISIEFDGVSMNSKVWINGHILGKRPSPYATFSYDLSPYLRAGANCVAVRVEHTQIADSRWYTGSGIYRHVWLNATEKIHVARHGVYVTTPEAGAEKATVAIQARVQNETGTNADVEVVTELAGPDQKVVQRIETKENVSAGSEQLFGQTSTVSSPRLWSPETPCLYHVVTQILISGREVDRVETPFGIRSIRFDAQAGFFLNGQPMKFKGICMHHDAGVLRQPVPDKVLERRLRLAKENGCNAIRTSHNPMAPEFYEICDRLGLMVMAEAFDEWTGTKNKWLEGRNVGSPSLHGSAEYYKQWAEADLREMVQRDRNHPCIMLWSIGNEIDYPNDPFSHPADGNRYKPHRPSAKILAQTAPRLIKVVRESDSSRPITMALANLPSSNATGLANLLDVVGYNYQSELYEKDFATYPKRKFIGSENGFEMEYVELTRNPCVAGQFLWAGFDFLGEGGPWPSRGSRSGMFDTCGFLKSRGALRAALWSEKPVVFIEVHPPRGEHRGERGQSMVVSHWNWDTSSRPEIPVDVYANCDTVELFLNGKSLGRKSATQATDCVFSWNVPYQPGELKAVGIRSGQTVEQRLVTAGAPARIELTADQTSLAADGRDVAHVTVRLVDAKGVPVPNADILCTARVIGAGRFLGLDNGDQRDMTGLRASSRHTLVGKALCYIQSIREPGKIDLIVSAPGLPDARLAFSAK